MEPKHVTGKNKGKIILYALSTCIWCRKTKKFLEQLDVEYDYIEVDMLEKNEKDQVMKTIEQWNPQCSFPTMVINNEKCIVGFNETKIKQELDQ